MSISATDFVEENAGGSDSDTNSDESPEYYQPISADDDDGGDSSSDEANTDDDFNFQGLSNGHVNGIASLDVNEEDGEDDEEERAREAYDSAISRAFREDERRRNAPLTPENAVRVMEAMRGISLGGLAPHWADRDPEDRWIDQLQRLRQPPPPHSTTTMLD